MKARMPLILVGFCFATTLHLGALPVNCDDPANRWTNAVEIPPGYSTIANPMNHARGQHVCDAVLDNSVAAVLPVVPVGTVLYKFDANTQEWSANIFRHRGWSNPDETFAPGDGAMIFNPKRFSFRATFTGNPVYGLSLALPAGLTFASYPGMIFEPLPDPSPVILPYWAISRRFNPQDGDIVYTFDSARGRFEAHRYHAKTGWDSVPVVAATESFFVFTKHPRTIVDVGPWPD